MEFTDMTFTTDWVLTIQNQSHLWLKQQSHFVENQSTQPFMCNCSYLLLSSSTEPMFIINRQNLFFPICTLQFSTFTTASDHHYYPLYSMHRNAVNITVFSPHHMISYMGQLQWHKNLQLHGIIMGCHNMETTHSLDFQSGTRVPRCWRCYSHQSWSWVGWPLWS